MDELLARVRATKPVGDIAYLCDALDHYRRGYAGILDENERLKEFARRARAAIAEAFRDFPTDIV